MGPTANGFNCKSRHFLPFSKHFEFAVTLFEIFKRINKISLYLHTVTANALVGNRESERGADGASFRGITLVCYRLLPFVTKCNATTNHYKTASRASADFEF